jgi:UDP-galactopyranose mutase
VDDGLRAKNRGAAGAGAVGGAAATPELGALLGTTAQPPRPTRCGSEGFDTLIVGAGFAGSVLAERLASQLNQRVLVVDRRPHIGGNAFDRYNDDGLLIHPYGPHIFHTNSAEVFDYLSRFTRWRPYQHRVLASVDGQLVPIPINLDTVNRLYGLKLTAFELEAFFAQQAEKKARIETSEDVVVARVGRDLYNKLFRGYTRKQWGLDPSELDASVTARVPTRTNRDDRYFADTYQAMPAAGYTRMFEAMLAHPNIRLMLNTDYRDIVHFVPWSHMVYTGPIDAFFDYRYGKLPYRSLDFAHQTLPQSSYQPVGTVNYPNDYAYTRCTEFKHLTGQQHPMTAIVHEYPMASGDPYYPVPRAENQALYRRYEAEADRLQHVTFVGRLASYRYYNMDQVVAQALATFKRMRVQLEAARSSRTAIAADESPALAE